MAAPARIIYAGVDACDLHLAQEFAAHGHAAAPS
jgi:hypothetical protein